MVWRPPEGDKCPSSTTEPGVGELTPTQDNDPKENEGPCVPESIPPSFLGRVRSREEHPGSKLLFSGGGWGQWVS